MNYHVKMAKALKERENIENIGPVIGHVVSIAPLKISILDVVILDGENLYITETLKNRLELNIDVLIIPQENYFFAIDKLLIGG